MPVVYPSQGSQLNPVSYGDMGSTTTLQSPHSSPSKDFFSSGCNTPTFLALMKKKMLDKINPSRSPTTIFSSLDHINIHRLINIMATKVTNQGIDYATFESLYNEKKAISEHRFHSESDKWRAWYTQSLVWGYFCELIFLVVIKRHKLALAHSFYSQQR